MDVQNAIVVVTEYLEAAPKEVNTAFDTVIERLALRSREAYNLDKELKASATKCHECTMADYGIGSHKHCGTCYCCKAR